MSPGDSRTLAAAASDWLSLMLNSVIRGGKIKDLWLTWVSSSTGSLFMTKNRELQNNVQKCLAYVKVEYGLHRLT